MKKLLLLLIFIFCIKGSAQDTTRILFIGNSFTYGNNMPWMVKAFADSAHIPVIVAMHAPPGVSVGDISDGTMAHMNNPALFSLIHSQKWDFAVLQDNQGRFVLDSAVFPNPNASKVVQGHLDIMDSVKANNSCAKIILFGGWAFRNGSPPYGNTGIEMIKRILCNYKVLNDTMKEVIAPIGEAWIKGVNYLPSVNLWDVDDAHPSYSGSYLTASVIFSTIFELPAKTSGYAGNLLPGTAYNLRCFADTSVFLPFFHSKYNLGGVKNADLQYTNGQFQLQNNYSAYTWYKNKTYAGNGSTLSFQGAGDYSALLQEADGCLIKTCAYYAQTGPMVSIAEKTANTLHVFPNPATSSGFTVKTSSADFETVELFSVTGVKQTIETSQSGEELKIATEYLSPGYYVLVLKNGEQVVRKTVIVGE